MESLRQLLLSQGAALVGYADLGPLPAEVRDGMPCGVSIAVALNPVIVTGIHRGPTREYYDEYCRVNALLNCLSAAAAEFLKQQGHEARPLPATAEKLDMKTLATFLPHKTVATRAGLGWIGKCALLVTKEYGSAVRLTTVLTDAELATAEPVNRSRCGKCTECVDVCPAGAPTGEHRAAGLPRQWFFDAFACAETAHKKLGEIGIDGYVCGMCIAACPWTKRLTSG